MFLLPLPLRSFTRTALLAALLAAAAAAQGTASDRERAEFGRICERLTKNNDYFGIAPLAPLRARFEAARAEVPEGMETPLQVGQLRNALAYHLIRLDRLDEAVALFDTAPSRTGADSMVEGMVHLARSEDLNCLQIHGGGTCVLPLTPEAIHRDPEPARKAAEAFRRALREQPDEVQARWLLQVAHGLSGGLPADLAAPPRTDGQAGDATPVSSESRERHPWLDVAHRLGLSGDDLAGGAVVDDFDGDGRYDIVTSSMDPCAPMRAWRNTGSRFEDVGSLWGLDAQLGGLNLMHADFDGDGNLDLLVLRGGWMGNDGRIRNSLLRNDLAESGRFVDVTVRAGLAQPAYPTQAAAWADVDLDGDLDLFVANESPEGSADPLSLGGAEPGFPSQLFLNQGQQRFRDVARSAGVQNLSFAKGAAWGDYDNDGDVDLYVSNIGPNRLFRNDTQTAAAGQPAQVRFSEVGQELGVAGDERTFATWWFDFDQDGDLDLFVARYSSDVEDVTSALLGLREAITHRGEPLLYRNDLPQGGGFVEIGRRLGLERPLLPMGANFGDLDVDGWPDIYLGTGVPRFDGIMPNVALRNVVGQRFEDVTFATGLGHLQKGHGVAFGDLDLDGDEDLVEQLGGAFPYDGFSNAIFLNPTLNGGSGATDQPSDRAGDSPSWLHLRLRSPTANRYAVGARWRLRVHPADAPEQARTLHGVVGTGGSFGGSSLAAEIGLGSSSQIEWLEVTWPATGEVEGGLPQRQRFQHLSARRIYLIEQGEQPVVVDPPASNFEADLPHRHDP